MFHRIASCLALLLAACATPAPMPATLPLFQDDAFGAPTERVGADDLFALSEPMRQFLKVDIAAQLRAKGAQLGLLDALSSRGPLRLEYDASTTRNAAQAFDARTGNCLSLVIMTAAFAKELGLTVSYQSAFLLEETWSRSRDLTLRSAHVNLTLGRRLFDAGTHRDIGSLTVDFLPPDEVRGLRTREVSEDVVVAMYMNNRAAEALVDRRLDDAYAWLREAIRRAPGYLSAYNTLGVVYLRHGDAAMADRVFALVLEREPGNTRAMFNRIQALGQLGRTEQALQLKARLDRLEPEPPFHFFDLGQAAAQRGDWHAARDLFAREVARAGYYHEFHYWLGVASFRLGDLEAARRHLALAMRESTSRKEHELYAAKLEWLRSRGLE